jgi:hypothetical protein
VRSVWDREAAGSSPATPTREELKGHMEYIQTEADLKKGLDEQVLFLTHFCEQYDQGKHGFAKHIANTLRGLLHDTENSKSLLHLMGIKDTLDFVSTKVIDPERKLDIYFTPLWVGGEEGNEYYVPLGEEKVKRVLIFEEWWNEVVLTDAKLKKFTRKDIIWTVANRDGGAHVGASLPGKYADLVKKNSYGIDVINEKGQNPIEPPCFPALRQIGYEVLITLNPGKEYLPERKDNKGILIYAQGFSMDDNGSKIIDVLFKTRR